MEVNRLALFISFLLIVALFSSLVFAQQTFSGTTGQKTFFSGQQQSKEKQLKEPLMPNEVLYPLASFEDVALENVIDPDKYIVGPGDLFYINITGDRTFTFPTKVTPEGKLVVETIGIYFVAGKPLSEVQRLIKKEGEKKYKLKKIYANLVQIRKLRVHVLGEVGNPGIYIAQAIDRVSYLLKRAEITHWANARQIEIRHTDGTVDTLDFIRYKQEGDLKDDNFVREGDIIYAPAINSKTPMVKVEGTKTTLGMYAIKKNEKLSQLLLRLPAFNRLSDLTRITVTRKETNSDLKTFQVNLFGDENSNQPSDLKLEDGDEIKIPSVITEVYVQGAVNIPGGFPYRTGLKAKDYVGLAGGTLEMGNLKKIHVVHFDGKSEDQGPNASVKPGDTIIVPSTFRKKFLEYLQVIISTSSVILAYMAATRRR